MSNLLKFSKEEQILFDKLINNEEIDIEKNIQFFKSLSDRAKKLDQINLTNIREKENKIIYYIKYYQNIYDDYILDKKINNTH